MTLAPKQDSQTGSPSDAPIFVTDAPARADALGQDGAIRLIGELICHKRAETPLTIAALGAPGAGKSTFLARLATRAEQLGEASAKAAGPFVGRLAVVRLNLSHAAEEPEASLAGAMADALARDWPALASEVAHAVRDPRHAVREATEANAAARRRLEDERRALDDVEGRNARIVETVLYESGGARIDSYARARRGELDARQRAFGFSGDPIDTYKDLVRDMAGAGGLAQKALVGARALWAFRGQGRLLFLAVLAFVLAWALGYAFDTRAGWIAWLRASSEQMTPTAVWIETHASWLASLRSLAIFAGLTAIAVNVLRAVRFMRPIMRGVTLLQEDVETRRRDLESLVAHHARRVEALSDEVDGASRRLEDAERRAGAQAAGSAEAKASLFSAAGAAAPARAYFARLDALAADPKWDAPRRFLFVIDGLDALTPSAGLDAVARIASLSHRAVTLVALEAPRCDAARLDRLVQIPLQLGAIAGDRARNFVTALLAPKSAKPVVAPEAAASLFDDALQDSETKLIGELAPLAGDSPRALKRFVNLYRLARHAAPQARAALALALAVETGGDAAEKKAFDALIAGETPDAVGAPRVQAGLEAARAAGMTPETLINGARIARAFSLRG